MDFFFALSIFGFWRSDEITRATAFQVIDSHSTFLGLLRIFEEMLAYVGNFGRDCGSLGFCFEDWIIG